MGSGVADEGLLAIVLPIDPGGERLQFGGLFAKRRNAGAEIFGDGAHEASLFTKSRVLLATTWR